MNILVPIAATRYDAIENQYSVSLYEIERKTIIQRVFEALSGIDNAHFVVVLRREDVIKFSLDYVVKLLVPNAKIIIAEGDTQGSACSCLLAVDALDENEPLVIAGSDQIIDVNYQAVINQFVNNHDDGGVIIFEDVHPRWSYVKLDEFGKVVEAAEKRPISKNATTGFFYFNKGSLFVEAAKQMILKGAAVNGQYYVCPAFNEMILAQKNIGTYKIKKEQYYKFSHQSGIKNYEEFLKVGQSNEYI